MRCRQAAFCAPFPQINHLDAEGALFGLPGASAWEPTVSFPDFIPSCKSAGVGSSSRDGLIGSSGSLPLIKSAVHPFWVRTSTAVR